MQLFCPKIYYYDGYNHFLLAIEVLILLCFSNTHEGHSQLGVLLKISLKLCIEDKQLEISFNIIKYM